MTDHLKQPPSLRKGFTLAELLIALAILGVIATFAIPKVLQSQQDQRSKAMAKETMAAVSGAYQTYKTKFQPTGQSPRSHELAPYLNYITRDTVSAQGGYDCGANGTRWCLVMPHGGLLGFDSDLRFGGTSRTNAQQFWYDPDGLGPLSHLYFYLYYDGRITTGDGVLPGTVMGLDASTTGPLSAHADPPWFSWN